MIINEVKSTATAHGFSGSENFSIKASSKAFKILSDNIYKDKIAAIIRELSTNAIDAHFDAKQSKPFKVKLPTSLDSIFSIRDYGTGLSYEMVMHLYTTYFESTKDQSNDYNGALGLGSKSPFSYTNTFSVNSYYKQRKYCYTSYISENDTPAILFSGDEPTEEEDGLEIFFPVNRNDINAFNKAARYIYHWFDNKPDTNDKDMNNYCPHGDIVLHHDNWKLYNASSPYHDDRAIKGPYVRQANIGYPISLDQIKKARRLTDRQVEILQKNLIIDAQTGSVNFAPSREELNYDTSTINYILSQVDKVYNQLSHKIRKDLADCKTKWERTTKFYKSYASGPASLQSQSFGNTIFSENIKVTLPSQSRIYKYGYGVRPNLRKATLKDGTATVDSHVSPNYSDKFEFFTIQKEIGGIEQFQKWRRDEDRNENYNSHDILITGSEDSIKKILDDFGNPPYTKMDHLLVTQKKMPTTAYGFDISVSNTKRRYDYSFISSKGDRITTPIEDMTGGYYFLVEDFGSFSACAGNLSAKPDARVGTSELYELYKTAERVDFGFPDKVIMIRKADEKKVKENTNLISYMDHAKTFAQQFKYTDQTKSHVFASLDYNDQVLVEFSKASSLDLPDDFYPVKEYFTNMQTKNDTAMANFKHFIDRLSHYHDKVSQYADDKNVNKDLAMIKEHLSLIREKYPLINTAKNLPKPQAEAYFSAMHAHNENALTNLKEI